MRNDGLNNLRVILVFDLVRVPRQARLLTADTDFIMLRIGHEAGVLQLSINLQIVISMDSYSTNDAVLLPKRHATSVP